MPNFTDKELTVHQIIGGCALILGMTMGLIGSLMLKRGDGLPEYMTCLKNTGWTTMIVSFVWSALASWFKYMK